MFRYGSHGQRRAHRPARPRRRPEPARPPRHRHSVRGRPHGGRDIRGQHHRLPGTPARAPPHRETRRRPASDTWAAVVRGPAGRPVPAGRQRGRPAGRHGQRLRRPGGSRHPRPRLRHGGPDPSRRLHRLGSNQQRECSADPRRPVPLVREPGPPGRTTSGGRQPPQPLPGPWRSQASEGRGAFAGSFAQQHSQGVGVLVPDLPGDRLQGLFSGAQQVGGSFDPQVLDEPDR
jgi:hypothetical protein